MAASVVQSKAVTALSTSSAVLTLDAPVSVGSVVLVQVYLNLTSRTASLTDDSASGQTWTAVGTMPQNPAGTTSLRQYVWRTVATEAFDTLTATTAGGSAHIVVQAIELAGVDDDPTVVAQETHTSASDPLATAGITTDAADQFLVGLIEKDSSSGAWSASADWDQASASTRTQILTREAPTAGTYACTLNWASTGTRHVTAVFAAFPVSDPVGSPHSFRYLSSFF